MIVSHNIETKKRDVKYPSYDEHLHKLRYPNKGAQNTPPQNILSFLFCI